MQILDSARRLLGDDRIAWVVRFVKALATAVVGTVLSQVALIGLLTGRVDTSLASVVAFLCGAIPNYFISRRWAWGRNRKPHLRTELLPYIVIVATTGVLATGLTTLTDHLIRPLALPELWRVVLLDVAFVGSYALVFLLKFALLDRLVFRGGRPPAEDEPLDTEITVPVATVPVTGNDGTP